VHNAHARQGAALHGVDDPTDASPADTVVDGAIVDGESVMLILIVWGSVHTLCI